LRHATPIIYRRGSVDGGKEGDRSPRSKKERRMHFVKGGEEVGDEGETRKRDG